MSGIDSANGEISGAFACALFRSAFGFLAPVSYCADRTSADLSGKFNS